MWAPKIALKSHKFRCYHWRSCSHGNSPNAQEAIGKATSVRPQAKVATQDRFQVVQKRLFEGNGPTGNSR